MVESKNVRIYLAVKSRDERSRMEDTLVLDGFDIGTFESASALWERFEQSPARLIITERFFPDGFTGVQLARQVRQNYRLPYNYIVLSSTMNKLKEISEALEQGVDDYLIRPAHQFQLRSRILVAIRWLNYIDSLYDSASPKQEAQLT